MIQVGEPCPGRQETVAAGQQGMLQHGAVWDEDGPSIGQRLDCCIDESSVLNNTEETTPTWRSAVVIQLRKEGDTLREIKVQFDDGLSPEDDRWVSWPQERNRFAPLGIGGVRHPSPDVAAPVAVAVANGGTATPGVTGGFSDSRSNSSVSSSTGAAVAALTKGKGFSRLKMYSPMKILMRSNKANASDVLGDESSRGTPAPAYDTGSISASAGFQTLSLSEQECKGEEKEGGGVGGLMMANTEGRDASAEGPALAATGGPTTEAELTEAFARRQPIRELTPHLVEQLDGEGGSFTLTVFRNNKQDKVPVPLVCGKYATKYEAERAAEAFSSPVWHEPSPSSRCSECQSKFFRPMHRRRHHCRNCGRLVCTACALKYWPKKMLPHSYRINSMERLVRVCHTCFSAQKDFRRALLTGSYLGAMEAYSTGCVNLRVPCTVGEFPVHCAAAGGSVRLLSWLIEDRCCPIFADEDKMVPLIDPENRSVMAAAADSGQVETMRYLAFTQPPTIMDLGGDSLRRGLQAYLNCNENSENGTDSGNGTGNRSGNGVILAGKSCYGLDGKGDDLPYKDSAQAFIVDVGYSGTGYSTYELPGSQSGDGARTDGGNSRGGAATGESLCIVCFSSQVNCTIVPCGHHCCCISCMKNVDLCPVCGIRVIMKVKAISA